MNQTPAPRPLHGPLRSRVNQLAHAQGLRYENALRSELMAQIQAARDGGATFDELAALVDKIEAKTD